MYSIGVGIGGMSIKVGVVDDNGKILLQSRVKTANSALGVVEDIKYLINDLIDQLKISLEDIKGIGIGCPGAVNSEKGIVDFLPNLGWENVDIVSMLKKYFNVPIKISNDANVATLAEVIYGSAKGYNTAIMFTLGTGVGGGIVIDKKLFEGGFSRGAELGHITLFLDGEQCTCGRRGCIECYTSATALIKQTKVAMLRDNKSKMWEYINNNIENVDGKTAFECAKLGDKTANEVVHKYVYYLAESMLNMFNIFRPEVFILGGGISAQGEYLINKLQQYCQKAEYGYKRAPKTKIVAASLGNDAGIIGASLLVKK